MGTVYSFKKVPINYLSIPGFEWLLVVLSIKSKLLALACKFSLSSTCLHLQTNLLSQSFHSLIACFFTATLIFFLFLEYAKFVLATGPLHLMLFLCTKLFTQIDLLTCMSSDGQFEHPSHEGSLFLLHFH